MIRVSIILCIFLLLTAGVILLQVFLSKKENKWLGRILPILFFLFSLIYPLNMMAPSEGMDFGFILYMLLVLLMANIPTIILIVIYMACREKIKKNKQLNKMNIQDLQ